MTSDEHLSDIPPIRRSHASNDASSRLRSFSANRAAAASEFERTVPRGTFEIDKTMTQQVSQEEIGGGLVSSDKDKGLQENLPER